VVARTTRVSRRLRLCPCLVREPLVCCLLLAIVMGCRNSHRALGTIATEKLTQDKRDEPEDADWNRLAAKDPLAFLEACRRHYRATIRDYRGLFRIQEAVDGVRRPEEHIKIRFREEPYSVRMDWIQNARRAARLTYVRGRWTKDGREMALILPAGVLGLLVPMGVKRDIHGADMAKDASRPVDEFGYDHTLRRIIEVCRRAMGRPQYRLRYVGATTFHGRPCYHLERHLPYSREDGAFPNRLLDIYIDREWLVPIGCLGYADDARTQLLGSYLLLATEFNVGLTDADF